MNAMTGPTRSGGRAITRRLAIASGAAALTSACTAGGSPRTTPGSTSTPGSPRFAPPPDLTRSAPGAAVVGVLEPTVEAASGLVRDGFRRAVFSLGWDAMETREGEVDRAYVARQRERLLALRAGGYHLVLDPGLQYPPRWLMGSPAAQFVDQEGNAWRGTSSEDVPDAVWNTRVRAAQERHLRRTAHLFGRQTFVAVRVGGLLSGELRLPPQSADGRERRLWGYGAAARALAPSAWRPGSGSPEEARDWLDWYCSSLTGYASWLARRTSSAFPGTELHVLFPGWGLRPGDLAAAAQTRGQGDTPALAGGTVSAALDWRGQVRALARLHRDGVDVVIHSTWLDAAAEPGRDDDASVQAPPTRLFGLAQGAGLDVAGENTGGGGLAALSRVREQGERWPLRAVTWMSEGALTADGSAVNALQVASLARG